jgi:hypothetical protein
MKNNIIKFLSIMFIILGPVMMSIAQPLPGSGFHALDPSLNGMPGYGAPNVECNAPNGAPVGTGLWIMLALGFIYGIYLFWITKKAEKLA